MNIESYNNGQGITLISVERSYLWNDAEQRYDYDEETKFTDAFLEFFKNTSDKEKSFILSDITMYTGLDIDALCEGYRCVYFDSPGEKQDEIFHGLNVSIEYVLFDNDRLEAVVSEGILLRQLERIGMDTAKRVDRVNFLCFYIESAAQDSCDILLSTLNKLISPGENRFSPPIAFITMDT